MNQPGAERLKRTDFELPNLTIANWNVERPIPGQPRFQRILKSLSEIESDIYFLTETHEELSPREGFYSLFSGEPDRAHLEGERWSAIWSRWPITSLNHYVSDKSRCVAGLIENSPFGKLIVLGTVLPWSTDPRAKELGSFKTYDVNLTLQSGDWERIRSQFPYNSCTFILAGDFNQSLAPAHYYGSKEKRVLLETILRKHNLEPVTSMQDDPIFRDSPPNACIDHICISTGGWKTISTTRWPDQPNLNGADSDHFGVRVEIG